MDTVTTLIQTVEDFASVTPCLYRVIHRTNGEVWGAVYNEHETHRYILFVIWDVALPLWFYGMLNPSTATELELDPTITRCRVRAERAGAGGILIGNSGAIRATDPREAIAHPDPIGSHNEGWLRAFIPLCSMHIAGYGSHAKKFGGDKLFDRVFRSCGTTLHSLRVNADGSPGHPLYIGYDVKPVPYRLGSV